MRVGSGNSALLYSIFGGDVEDLRTFLSEERFPENWEPKVRWSYGHSIVVSCVPSSHHNQRP